MLKIGNLVVAGTVAIGAGGCAIAPAALSMATLNQDQSQVSESVANCREQADAVAQARQPIHTENAIVNGAIGLVSAAIGGYNKDFAVRRGVTGAMRGANSDRLRTERTNNNAFDRCMRQHEVASRSR